jgi:hypothetical protein
VDILVGLPCFGEGSKRFFFEKKKQKTFVPLVSECVGNAERK